MPVFTTPKPETIPLRQAAARLGISQIHCYELVRLNKFPVPVIRAGNRILVPVKPLDRLLEGQ